LQKRVEIETVPTHQALGRVTAEAVLAPEHLPAFPRSTMDGYAVRARETFGASESLPAYLEVVGRCGWDRPGHHAATGRAALTSTGGMLAHRADAVVMVEIRRRSTPPR
jgi:molybdopterin molybdotransferase